MLAKQSPTLVLALVLLAMAGTIFISHGSATAQGMEEKKVPLPYSKPGSGPQMYNDYCAACHGPGGKGDGPAAAFLKEPPADLTTMAKRNGGKFPEEHFTAVLSFGTEKHAHGTSEMPVWGPLFRSQNKDVARLRIHNLSLYVQSLQQK